MNFDGIKVIIFDLGGTIVDDREVLHNTYCRVVNSLGTGKMPLERKEFDRLFTANWIELYHRIGINEDPQKLIRMFKQISLQPDYYTNIKTYPGAKEVLQKLRHKFRLTIATSLRMDELNLLCTTGVIDPLLFDEIVAHDHVTNLKPHPEPLELIMKKLDIAASDCVMIGDTVSDIMAGKNAGSKTIAVTWGTNSAEDLKRAKPDAVVNSWQELEKLFL